VLTALKLHILLNLSPLGTAVLVGLILGERLTPGQRIGMLTVVFGVNLVQWRKGGVETLSHSPLRVTIQNDSDGNWRRIIPPDIPAFFWRIIWMRIRFSHSSESLLFDGDTRTFGEMADFVGDTPEEHPLDAAQSMTSHNDHIHPIFVTIPENLCCRIAQG
jgi:hypothetical protein